MNEQLIVAKNTKTALGERLQLGYYLLSDRVELTDIPAYIGYGIRILLRRESGAVEEATMPDLSGCKSGVLTLIRILAAHTVLPIAMHETVLDYMEENELR